MKDIKHFLKKLLFITVSLSAMLFFCEIALDHFGVAMYLTLHTVIGGVFFTIIATRLFDRYARKKRNEKMNAKLKEALHDLKEIKSTINQ